MTLLVTSVEHLNSGASSAQTRIVYFNRRTPAANSGVHRILQQNTRETVQVDLQRTTSDGSSTPSAALTLTPASVGTCGAGTGGSSGAGPMLTWDSGGVSGAGRFGVFFEAVFRGLGDLFMEGLLEG